MDKKKNIIILGSTGSIGTQTIEVIAKHPQLFKIVGLAANSRFDLLARQIKQFKPQMVCIGDKAAGLAEIDGPGSKFKLVRGPEGLKILASLPGADMVVNALVGSAGLEPTLAAVKAGHDVALANKETLVAGGQLVMPAVKKNKVRLLPIDSEHVALHQCLEGRDPATVKNLILTASGGPFRNHSLKQLDRVKARHALNHPTWSMGKKVTIDSATLMNKGLEMIEAHYLFGLPPERIKIVIHPESIIHSMVEFSDGSIIAYLSTPDMRLPIQYALTHPQRLPSLVKECQLDELPKLTFHKPDRMTFKCLGLAYLAIKRGGIIPAVMNAANEAAVQAFLEGRIKFLQIPGLIAGVMNKFKATGVRQISDVTSAGQSARRLSENILKSFQRE
ncbi:1-deoxy-D-xylulose-5-phosphate reductoisomerase [candidate division TA06 bacterium]|uniref:1-deoxy-D-xylulose 5-phosphate reductoisomerase n=1 Tax=candidate division TA06 bacterium TaxID=2250710 RepID=A0A933MH45_UNCT6|nr:1-deoxy-D-xylulose-5-phosphate reductoisomerase [candidate division TA06 bacterium]